MLLLTTASVGFSQQTNYSNTMPEFKGGSKEFVNFINKNFSYPKQAKQNCIGGNVNVRFVIDTSGNVASTEAINSIGFGCDEEALRLINMTSGKWKPGTQNGNPINTSYSTSILFKIEEDCIPIYESYLEKGKRLMEKENYGKAIVEFNKVIDILPYNPDALLKRGICKLNLSDTSGACEDWNKIPEILNGGAKEYLDKYCNK